jgi:hypothetical protein
MDRPPDLELLPKEDRVKLALQATKNPQNLSVRRAADVYKVPKSTLKTDAPESSQHAIPTPNHQL